MFNITNISLDRAALLERVRAYAKDVPDENIELFSATLSNQTLDDRNTKMSDKTLSNYTSDINQSSVPLLIGHDRTSLPVGRIFNATLSDNKEVNSIFYIQKGLTINGQSTDDLIGAIRGGTITDVSVGFTMPEQINCSICNKNLMTDNCRHYMGKTYDGKQAFAWIDGSHLNEASLVSKGSTPGAKINKYIRSGVDTEFVLNLKLGEKDMFDWKDFLTRNSLSFGEIPDDERLAKLAEAFDLERKSLNELKTQIEPLKAMAVVGEQYKKDLAREAKEARIKALGTENWKPEEYETFLLTSSADFIKAERSFYQTLQAQTFQDGKRPTLQIKEIVDQSKTNKRPVNSSLDKIYGS